MHQILLAFRALFGLNSSQVMGARCVFLWSTLKNLKIRMHHQRVVALDGLRGWAALGVALPHYLMMRNWHVDISEPISIVAVEIFFVLSGFVLAPQILYCLSTNTRAQLPVFFLRRWMRTLPPYILALFVMGVLTGHLFDISFLQHLFFVQNFFSIDDKGDFFMPAWSLAVEEWFYVVFPLYLVLMKRLGRDIVTSALWFVCFFFFAKVIGWLSDPNLFATARRLVIFRLDSICFGFLLFIGIAARRERTHYALALISAVAVIISTIVLIAIFKFIEAGSRGLPEMMFLYVASAFGASLIVLAVSCERTIRASGLLSWTAAWLGKLSYDVYLFHMPLIIVMVAAGTGTFGSFFGYLFLLMATCAAVYSYFERPILAGRPQYLSAQEERSVAIAATDLRSEGARAKQSLFVACNIVILTITSMSLLGERLVTNPSFYYLYYLADAFFLAGAIFLMFSAMLCSRAKYRNTSRSAMIASGMIVSLVLTDQYILNFRYDTSGPGGFLVTHANWIRTFVKNNSSGFWEREISSEQLASNNPLIVAATGTSFTWGQGVKGSEHRFTRVLENLFHEDGLPATVLNFTPAVASHAIAAMDKFHPKVVLLCYTLSDVDGIGFVNVGQFRPLSGLQRMSVFNPTLNLLDWKLFTPQQYQLFALALYVDRVLSYTTEESFTKIMNGIIAKANEIRTIGAKPVYVLLPYPHMWLPFAPALRETARKKLMDGLEKAGITLVDLDAIADGVTLRDFEANPMDSHPNEKMHDLIGHRLHEKLLPVLAQMNLIKSASIQMREP
jgi:peptidoglycan/LPS O-acetylase OafA/YrhL